MPNFFPQDPPPWAPMTPAPGYASGNPNVLPTPRIPQAEPQEGIFLPPGAQPEGAALPYGMGDCRTFLDIPPLVHFSDGSTCINPDYDAIHTFSLAALARNPGFPTQNLVTNPTLAAGNTIEFQLTVEREENGMGHFLIEELLMLTTPGNGIAGLLVEIKTLQGDMVYTNAPAPALNIFGTAQLACCLPCPIMLYPNQTLIFTVTNATNPAVPVTIQIVARGRRFMPYHNMGLVKEMERCWSMIQTVPYWISFDQPVTVPAGAAGPPATPGIQRGQMSIPGGGFFQMVRPLVQVIPVVPAAVTADDILIEVTDGRIGKRFMDGPISLGAHWATPTITVTGFPGDLFRAASACHCPPPSQFIRGNTRLIHDLQNPITTSDAEVRITYAGCFHFADRCPPQKDLELVRAYGTSNANRLRQAQEEGDRIYLNFVSENPLFAGQPDGCAAPSAQGCVEEDVRQEERRQEQQAQAPRPPQPPEPPRIVSMHRPGKPYYGPGTSGALPPQYSWGVDQYGKTHLVVINPRTGALVRFANSREVRPFARWLAQINAQSQAMQGLGRYRGRRGRSGLGSMPQGEWEAI